MSHVRVAAIVLGVWVASPTAAQPPALAVAAASDLQSVMPGVAARFERESGQHVALTFGSSGNFFSQIRNGAPFDLFFSADVDYPRQLEADGLAEPGTVHPYAVGTLVLYIPAGTGLDLKQGLAVLADARVRRIAIANPDHAPYGRAAVAALRRQGLYDRVRAKLVLGENISQAAQFVQSGNAEAGLLALSLSMTPAMKDAGAYVEIPRSDYPLIEQAAVVVKASADKKTAREFLAFFARPEIVQLLQQAGFREPRPAPAAR